LAQDSVRNSPISGRDGRRLGEGAPMAVARQEIGAKRQEHGQAKGQDKKPST
jgi:hypothetical protein